MAITKTEQGRLDRVAEREARAAATQARRDKTAQAQARSEQRKGPNPSSAKSTMDQREAAAGLNLAGNDTMSGRRGGISIPTMDQREAAAGLTLAGNNTTAGREDSFYSFGERSRIAREETQDWGVYDAASNSVTPRQGSFPAIICVNGEARYATIQGQIGGPVEPS